MAKHNSIILEISQRLYLTTFRLFNIIENGKGDNPANKTTKTTYRDYEKLDMDSFKIDLPGIYWAFATQNNDVNLGFEAFPRLLNTTLDKYAPIKEFTKKRRKR